ncbi:MAG TPA: arginase [Hellea balneolensis]|uniref:Arginase n=1 Tax=Hellea balneolensis TaxID=287478 RepID=A0A7C3GMD3_9PROT|nr:arginase [Hellea balneolensis]
MQNKDWPNIAGLFNEEDAQVAILGAPMTKGCVTPSDYHKAPDIIRKTLSRISTYDLETATDLDGLHLRDFGDIDIATLSPKDGFTPLVKTFRPVCKAHDLSILLGGHNGITRAGVHALDPSLRSVGVLTLDAHFDLRPTDKGLMNGNPIAALLEDGLPGEHIVQIGIAPFANSRAMHARAIQSGISVYTMADCRGQGIEAIINSALKYLRSKCDVLYVDFDIDVIERGLSPGAPGGRPGGLTPDEFFAATRLIGADETVRAVDLSEFDPALDVSDMTALIAARWMAELLCGFKARQDHRTSAS